jgi:hypothetical protein
MGMPCDKTRLELKGLRYYHRATIAHHCIMTAQAVEFATDLPRVVRQLHSAALAVKVVRVICDRVGQRLPRSPGPCELTAIALVFNVTAVLYDSVALVADVFASTCRFLLLIAITTQCTPGIAKKPHVGQLPIAQFAGEAV